jgi:negative regulator of flagellin synthesis FlgM
MLGGLMKVNPKTSNDLNKILQEKTVANANAAETKEVGKNSGLAKNKEVITQSAKDQSAKIDLSPRAQEMKRAKEAAMASPDVDHEKVKKFQNLIDKGLYKVDAGKVADKMVDDSLLNALHDES